MTVRDVWERLRRPVHIRWNRWTSPEETKSCRRNAGRLRDPHGLRKVFAEISVKVERQWRRDDFFFPPPSMPSNLNASLTWSLVSPRSSAMSELPSGYVG